MHGIGNDYIYVDCFKETVDNPGALSKQLSDRHFGIGSDGLVLICPSDTADFRMDMYNSDGSRGKMCGNAIRCIGKYVYENAMTEKTRISIETLSGIKYLELDVSGGKVKTVTVDMGCPSFLPSRMPMLYDGAEAVDFPLEVGSRTYRLTCVSMGNPHAVLYVDDVEKAPVETVGPFIEKNALFPEGVNVEFVRIIDRKTLEMRVWERGAGETLACGTGACAVLVASVKNGLCENSATVRLRGGDLSIRWDEESGKVFKTGGAAKVFQGVIDFREDF